MDYAEDLDTVMPVCNLIEYSSGYSKTTGTLCFYLKDEATDFNGDVVNDNNFKTFKYKAKLLGSTISQVDNGANEILKDAPIPEPLKYLSNFWKSLKMSLINCKVELKLQWFNYWVLSAARNDNANDHDDNITFTTKDTKLYDCNRNRTTGLEPTTTQFVKEQ